MPRKVAGTSDRKMIKRLMRFEKKGIKVVTLGENYLISVRSAMLFPDQSPRLLWAAYQPLNEIVGFIKEFRKVGIHVTAFCSPYRSTRREDALTLARARVVADYLWSQGIDSRLIIAKGEGSRRPFVASTQGGDKSANSRIEITFRDAII